ncbi:hypothetical protein MMC30_008861 [Trapelia coarctata]|nr:hypothetical protein [Trapelia coarctata]
MAFLSLEGLNDTSISESQLFSSIVTLAAAVEPDFAKDKSISAAIGHFRGKDLGYLNRDLCPLGYGSSFFVSAVPPDEEGNLLHKIAVKRSIPAASTKSDESTNRRVRSMILELRVLTHNPIRKHENIVKLLGIAWEMDPHDFDRRWPALLLQRAMHGTLQDYLEESSPLSYDTKSTIILDISLGLDVLHQCGIFHGDIKLENVLVFDNDDQAQLHERPVIARLADFGGVLYNIGAPSYLSTPTRFWAAPECRKAICPADIPKADVYSLGFLIWRVFADGVHPFLDSALRNDFRANSIEEKADEIKLSDDKLTEHLRSFAKPSTVSWQSIQESLLEHTIRVDPNHRSLDAVLLALGRIAKVARQPADFGGLATHQRKLKEGVIEFQFSFKGIESLPISVTKFISAELAKSANSIQSQDLVGQAAYGMALLYFNNNLHADPITDNISIGLEWLSRAAVKGNPRARSVIFRIMRALGHGLTDEVLNNFIIWLSETAAKGYFIAFEDLASLELPSVYEEAKVILRRRYGGTGEQRYAEDLPLAFPLTRAESFDADIFKRLSTEPDFRDYNYNNYHDRILHFAAYCDLRVTMSKVLGQSVHDVDIMNVNGETPLLLACRSGNYHVAMQLLEAGANPSLASHSGDTPIHWLLSFSEGHMADVGRRLIEKSVDLNAVADEWAYNICAENVFIHGTPLMRAVSRNRIDVARFLLEAGANPNFVTRGASAINLSAQLHYPELLALLFSVSRDNPPAYESSTGMSVLIPALRGGTLEEYAGLFARIRRHGSDWMLRAEETLRVILEGGGSDHLGDLPGSRGMTALALAVHFSQPDIVQFMLKHGCAETVNTISTAPNDLSIKCTPLIMSVWMKDAGILSMLLEHGADAKMLHDIGDGFPVTALYECARGANDSAIFAQILIDAGIGVDQSPANYEPPLACALRNRCFELAGCLLDNGADINIHYGHGLSLLHAPPKTILGYLIQECSIGSVNCLEFIFSRSPGIEFTTCQADRRSALHELALVSHAKQDDRAIRLILDLLLDFFEPNQDQLDLKYLEVGLTALHLAALRANYPVVYRLLNEGADPTVGDRSGLTPLNRARFCFDEFPAINDSFETCIDGLKM